MVTDLKTIESRGSPEQSSVGSSQTSAQMELERKFFTVKEVCWMTHLSRATIAAQLANGELSSVTVGRARRAPAVALKAWLRKLESDSN